MTGIKWCWTTFTFAQRFCCSFVELKRSCLFSSYISLNESPSPLVVFHSNLFVVKITAHRVSSWYSGQRWWQWRSSTSETSYSTVNHAAVAGTSTSTSTWRHRCDAAAADTRTTFGPREARQFDQGQSLLSTSRLLGQETSADVENVLCSES
jgi:hypothetical protein